MEPIADRYFPYRPLFRVDGDLVGHYNRCLEKVRGLTTGRTSFTIDKRGVSPELQDELGPLYLENGPSHRYMIILSPEQKDVPLLAEEFTFDNEVIDFFYNNCYPAIMLATRVDGIYVELDDNVHDFVTPDDVLLVRKITMEAYTPSGFLSRARELQDLVARLQADPELLIADESLVPRRIAALVSEIGDVRGFNLSSTRQVVETGHFFSGLFGGVYVFRETAEATIKAKRPIARSVEKAVEREAEPGFGKRMTAIFCEENRSQLEAEFITRLSFSNTEQVLSFLLKNELVNYDQTLIDRRLRRIEDEAMLAQGIAVGALGYEERSRALETLRNAMPDAWRQLMRLKREVDLSGFSGKKQIVKQDVGIRKMLLKPACEGPQRHVVTHLLTRLFPYDYEMMSLHNTADLAARFAAANENKRNYILAVVANRQEADL